VGIAAGAYTHSLGNWLFIVVLITIGPLATTELGTDGWMPDLLKLSGPDFPNFATWVFVYVSGIMTVLRFYSGPVVHRLSPIGLLVFGAFISIIGLNYLSTATGWTILAASTVYAFGKTFLWSTTLGLTSEQFPKGGALTLNGVSAVGVLFLGVLGSPYIGYKQDVDLDKRLKSPAGRTAKGAGGSAGRQQAQRLHHHLATARFHAGVLPEHVLLLPFQRRLQTRRHRPR
jgi:hypothetical protein